MTNRRLYIGAVIALILMMATGCGGSSHSPTAPTSVASVAQLTPPVGGPDGEGGGSGNPRLPYGEYIDQYDNVAVYSNGNGTHDEPLGDYGYQYECVEFVNRFYVTALHFTGTCGAPNMRGCGNAKDYFDNAKILGLDAFANGSSTKPAVNDILVFSGGSITANCPTGCGHVAIVREVSSDSVTVVQQNYYDNSDDLNISIPMTVASGTYTVQELAKSSAHPLVPRGWLRIPNPSTISTPTPSPTPAPTPSPSPEPTPSPNPTPSPAPSPTPAPVSPTATTASASSVGTGTATLNGSVNPNGTATSAYFQWGLTASYGYSTSSQSLGNGTTALNVSSSLTGLNSGTTYHFRIVATNSAGTSDGVDYSFTTDSTSSPPPAPPPAPPPVVYPTITSISPSSVVGGTFDLTINGSGFDSGAVDRVYQPNGSFMGQGSLKSRSANQIIVTEFMAGAAPFAQPYIIKVENGDGHESNGIGLTLYDQITVSPGFGVAGTAFSYTGRGFTGNFGVTSHLKKPDGTEFSTLSIPTAANGTFSSTINSSGFARGTYEVWAIDNNTGVSSAHAFFIIQ